MKTAILLITAAAFVLLPVLSFGQTKTVLKNVSGNTITENLTFPSGKTLTIAAGATINATGATITGFGSGGGPTALDDLTDVTITSATTGQLPRYNSVSGMWENWTPGTMASQNANGVSISGGSISGVTISGSTISGLNVDAVLFDQGNGTTTTLSGGGAVDLTFTLPTTGTSLLSNSSSLPAANLTGTISDSRLSATVTKLGSSIDLASEVTGSLPHANIAQSGATSGQALAWNGSAWAPATVAATPGGSSGQVQYNNAGAFGGVTGLTLTTGTLSAATVTQTALGTTPAAGISLENSTAAAAGAQQVSPALELAGRGWKTTATAASHEVRFRAHVLPTQGTTAPTGTLIFSNSIAGGAFTQTVGFRSDGNLLLSTSNVSTGYMYSWVNGGVMLGRLDVGAPSVYAGYTGLEDTLGLPSTGTIGFSSNARSGDFTSPDAFFRRNGVAEIQMGTDVNGNAVDQKFKAADGITGTDRSGGDLTLASGDSTGSGSSVIILSTSAAGSTGTTTRAATERVRISSAGIQINSGPIWASGTGSPEGVVTAGIGSIYLRTDGGASTSLYVKESGTGNTGWTAK